MKNLGRVSRETKGTYVVQTDLNQQPFDGFVDQISQQPCSDTPAAGESANCVR